MKYEEPVNLTEEEIRNKLKDDKTSPPERTGLVLSAICFCSTPFAGNVLNEEFRTANHQERLNLKNCFEKFHGIHQTDYRAREAIELLENYKEELLQFAAETDCTIDGLREYAEMLPSELDR